MSSGVCPCLPKSGSGIRTGGETATARMTKRRAESASPFCSEPEKKRCRSACSSADPPLTPPPAELQCPALPDSEPRCRKRPGRPDPLESLPERKKAPAADRAPSPQPAAADCSGKFMKESGAEPRGQRPGEAEKRLGKPAVMQRNEEDDNVTEDQLSAFNTFQFWRPPLPELDLSLLDPQLSEDAATKDSAEAMET
ncbi:uncharacterized protein C9orf40 homolog [Astyanax mexicanus]|uniref:uncharacterized protein C9orf40 homolog n=1 Tax=Astyanax mexicanus TaxID=7994 RepID=UPI0020CAD2CE|nr:uncharacterized protein C9orf40 homolog [Astyanax mexicanus]